jgi:hypothetical protein
MPQASRVSRRALGVLAVVGATAGVGGACAVAAIGASACITTAPPDLPTLPARGPRILEDAARPPSDEFLMALPEGGVFVVPVEVTNPLVQFQVRVLVDYYPGINNTSAVTGNVRSFSASPALDGGLTLVQVVLNANDLGDPTACHVIQLFVADTFAINSSGPVAGDTNGADSITWFYAPNGPGGCYVFDAGADGAQDAAPDGTLIIPPGTN